MTALNVSVFNGKTLNTASLVGKNVGNGYKVLISVLNNTYILASPYAATGTTIVNFTYYTVPRSFNYTYLQALGYLPNAIVAAQSSDTQHVLYTVIGCVIGLAIIIIMILFFGCSALCRCLSDKYAGYQLRKEEALARERKR